MRGDIKWTNLSRRQIAERMGALGTPVSRDVVSQLLRQHGYRRRKAQKKKTMGHHRDRNAQFEKIARLRKKYLKAGLPVISIDTKKKELLGDFYREGRIDAQATIETNDHDFSSTGSGVVIPHGVYDVGRNRGFLHLNTSHDTSELACDSIAAWWDEHGRSEYPGAKRPGQEGKGRRVEEAACSNLRRDYAETVRTWSAAPRRVARCASRDRP